MVATAIDLQPYASSNDENCDRRITRARKIPGDRAVIFDRHYQRDAVFRHTVFSGDSPKLSRQAADSNAGYIRIRVPPEVAENARIAHKRLLEI